MPSRRCLLGLVALAACALAAPASAGAAWPGANGRLVFNTIEDDEYRLVTTDLHERHKRVLARFPPLPSGLQRTSGLGQWSPSGARVLYQRIATGFETVAPDGSRKRTLRTGMLWPSWAPSGREIVAVAEDGSVSPAALVRLRPDGSRLRRIPTPPSETGVAIPRWSPSGRWILYEQSSSHVRYIWRVRPDGTGARRLVAGWSFSWAPDGRRFAYTAGREIWSMRRTAPGGGCSRAGSRTRPSSRSPGRRTAAASRSCGNSRPTGTTPRRSRRSARGAAANDGCSAASATSRRSTGSHAERAAQGLRRGSWPPRWRRVDMVGAARGYGGGADEAGGDR